MRYGQKLKRNDSDYVTSAIVAKNPASLLRYIATWRSSGTCLITNASTLDAVGLTVENNSAAAPYRADTTVADQSLCPTLRATFLCELLL